MTARQKLSLEGIVFVSFAVFMGSFFVRRNNQHFQNILQASSPSSSGIKIPKVITPSLNPVSKIETAAQISPDGTKKLNMKKTSKTDGTSDYVFTVTDGSGENGHEIYTATLPTSESFSIPFNTWSPDDKYFFIQKNGTGALVFPAAGEPVNTDQKYLDTTEIFTDKIKTVTPKLVTGWASYALLIVNTVKEDGGTGPSYWFEVPSKTIIELSSQF